MTTGKGCTIYQNVTIGGDTDKEVFNDSEYLKQPSLGDNVVILHPLL